MAAATTFRPGEIVECETNAAVEGVPRRAYTEREFAGIHVLLFAG